MGFYEELQSKQKELDTVYDLASFCYDFITNTVGDQECFIGMYIWKNADALVTNPNLDVLCNFSEKAERRLRKLETEGIPFEKCLNLLGKLVDGVNKSIKNYGVAAYNDATVPYFLLLTIDRYMLSMRKRCTRRGPLNKSYCDKSYVYLKSAHSIIEEAMLALEFSNVIEEQSVGNQLNNLVIIEKTRLPERVEAPQLVPLVVDEEDDVRRQIVNGKEWNVAVIPLSEHPMVRFPVEYGTLFRVEYEEEHLHYGIDRALRLLDKAIDAGANVVIFPEFVCYPEMQKAIGKHLEQLFSEKRQRVRRLFWVLAGSGWYEDNNNIAYMYSYSGRLIGKHYKFSRYSQEEKLMENLSYPGKETTIVSIEGIGESVVGICKDVSDGTYTNFLAERFCPSFLLIPAWSKSVNIGFKEQMKSITAKVHATSSILCNCCEAVRNAIEFKEENGMIVTPYKEGTVVTGKERKLLRRLNCNEQCNRRGCFWMVHMVFHPEAVKNNNVVDRIEQKFAWG